MNKLTSLAVAVIATSSMLSAAQAVTVTPNFGGYVRAGLDHAQHGKYDSWNKSKVGRFGNESDIWSELALGASITGPSDAIFGVQTRLAYSNDAKAEGKSEKVYLDEVYGTVKNVFSFSKDATIWAGKRYYHREQTEIMDYKWYQIEGIGAGIEYIDVGPGKLSFAWFGRNDANFSYNQRDNVQYAKDYTDPDDPNDTNKGNLTNYHWDGKAHYITDIELEKYDLEYGMTLWEGSWLNLRGTLLHPQQDDNNYMELVYKPKISNAKILAASLGTSYGIGYCTTVAQYIGGPTASSTFGNGSYIDYWGKAINPNIYNVEKFNGIHRWQFLNYGDMKVGDFGLAHSLYYTVASGFEGTGTDKESDKAFSFAVRPYYKLTDVTKIAAELGFFTETTKYQNGESKNNKGQKVTLAYVLSPDAGDWKSRPELRFYVTYLHSNDVEALENSPSQDMGVTVHYKDGTKKYLAPRDNQLIVGAQLEAWW